MLRWLMSLSWQRSSRARGFVALADQHQRFGILQPLRERSFPARGRSRR